jgi:hypothetical protein
MNWITPEEKGLAMSTVFHPVPWTHTCTDQDLWLTFCYIQDIFGLKRGHLSLWL